MKNLKLREAFGRQLEELRGGGLEMAEKKNWEEQRSGAIRRKRLLLRKGLIQHDPGGDGGKPVQGEIQRGGE